MWSPTKENGGGGWLLVCVGRKRGGAAGCFPGHISSSPGNRLRLCISCALEVLNYHTSHRQQPLMTDDCGCSISCRRWTVKPWDVATLGQYSQKWPNLYRQSNQVSQIHDDINRDMTGRFGCNSQKRKRHEMKLLSGHDMGYGQDAVMFCISLHDGHWSKYNMSLSMGGYGKKGVDVRGELVTSNS